MVVTVAECIDSIMENRGPVLPGRITLNQLEAVLVNLETKVEDESLLFLKYLKPYDFKGILNIWSTKNGKNYALARELTHQVVQTLMINKHWSFVELVRNVSQKDFRDTKINRWGANAGGMIGHVYEGIHSNAILDLVQNDLRYAEHRDLHWYDFQKSSLSGERIREPIHILLQKLMKDNGWSFVELIKNMRNPPQSAGVNGWNDAFKRFKISRYGTTLQGVLDHYGGCAAEAVLELVKNDPRYKEYSDLEVWDFPDMRNIWTFKDKKKNFERARKATGILLEKLKLKDLAFSDILKNLTLTQFVSTPINRYGTKLYGMINQVYNTRLENAIQDWYTEDRRSLLDLV